MAVSASRLQIRPHLSTAQAVMPPPRGSRSAHRLRPRPRPALIGSTVVGCRLLATMRPFRATRRSARLPTYRFPSRQSRHSNRQSRRLSRRLRHLSPRSISAISRLLTRTVIIAPIPQLDCDSAHYADRIMRPAHDLLRGFSHVSFGIGYERLEGMQGRHSDWVIVPQRRCW